MAGVEQNRYKTNNGCIKHLPQTGMLALCVVINIILIFHQSAPLQEKDAPGHFIKYLQEK